MTLRRLPLLVAALALAAVIVALVGRGQDESVVGVVVEVQSEGLVDVRAFSVRTDDGRTLTFRIDALENGAEFPPGHLVEHQATSERVRVFFRRDGEALVAFRIVDAPA